jgi:hypothetical protein
MQGNKNIFLSPVDSPIYFVEKLPCGQVNSLLDPRPLRPRQKGDNFDHWHPFKPS